MDGRRRIVGLGAGGHAAVLIETFRATGAFDVVGLLSLDKSDVLGVPVLGSDDMLPSLKQRQIDGVFLGVGMMKNASIRRRLVAEAHEAKMEIVGVIHPSALVAPSVIMGQGVQILAGAIVQSRAWLGNHVLINSGAIIEHDARIDDFAHVATGAHLAGGVRLGNGAFVGAGAVVIQSITIGAGAIVGAGAVVIADVPDGVTVAGVPARPLRTSAAKTLNRWQRDLEQHPLGREAEFSLTHSGREVEG